MINIDLVTKLIELKQAGFSNMAVQERVGCSYPTINAIANGRSIDPPYSIAQGIIDLHDYHCKGKK